VTVVENGPENRVERRMRETRARIQQAALELFALHGLADTTVAAITARADVGKGTFFTYFPTKVAVLTGVAAGLVEQMHLALTAAHGAGLSFPDRLRRMFAPALDWHQAHPEISRFMAVAFLEDASYADADQPNTERLLAIVSDEIAASQDRSELTRAVSADHATTALFGVYFGALATWHIGKRRDRLHDHFTTSFDVLMRGLRP
jgi:AcrR family transcriptional regulator